MASFLCCFFCSLDVFLPILYIHALGGGVLQPTALEVVDGLGGIIGR